MQQIMGSGLLGVGMNVVQTTPQSALTAAIVTPVSGCPTTYPYHGVDYCIPHNVSLTPGFGDRTTSGSVIVASSRSDFQSEFSAEFGIEGSYNAFSGEFNAAFESESKSQQQYWYAMLQGSYEAYTLLLDQESGIELSSQFLNDPDVQLMLQQGSFGPSNQDIFFRVFSKWGTHYVYQVAMGASIQYCAAVEASFASDSATISADLSLEYNAVFVAASTESSAEWETLGQAWSNARSISILSDGGDAALLSSINPSFDDSFSAQFSSWRASIPNNLGVMQFFLRDLSTLLDGQNETAVSQALSAYLSSGLFAQASFNTQAGGFNTSIATLIRVGLNTIAPTPPAPSTNQFGGMQLVLIDSTSLATLVNIAVYPSDYTQYANSWTQLLLAAEGSAGGNYFALLTVFGAQNVSAFPSAAMVSWLQSCGGTVESWINATQLYCGNNYNVAYSFIGQNGAPPGSASETFAIDQATEDGVPAGFFFANSTGPLVPSPAGGPYILIGA